MKEKLIIKNFGPIKSVELSLGKFNIFIGESGTGKSTIAKIFAVCKYFSFITNFRYFEKEGSAFSWGLLNWGLDEYIQKKSYIFYSCEDYSLEVNAVKSAFDPWIDESTSENSYDMSVSLLPPFSEKFSKLLFELRKLNNDKDEYSLTDTPTSFFQNPVASVMNNPLYIPAERSLQSIFSIGKGGVQNSTDALFNQLADIDKIMRSFKRETAIEPLNLVYKSNEGNSVFRKINQKKFFTLGQAATGFQSTIPIVLAIKYYKEIRRKIKSYIIEEPEANIFPTTQSALVRFLSENIEYIHSLLITTHSPYILTSLNNLMYAFKVGENYPDETDEVINKKYWINPDDVSAYMLLQDGTCEDIIDREENLIKAEKIDSVSDFLNEQFDALLNIELVPK